MRRIGIVGASGLVGEELMKLIATQSHMHPILFARSDFYHFTEIDCLFLCTPAAISKTLAPLGIASGATVIDLSSAFRQDPHIPLSLPSVNRHLLETKPPLVSCPNCIVAILLTLLGPLHKAFAITRLHIVTYQAASGAGKEGLTELLDNLPPRIFPHPLTHNLFLHESPPLDSGYSEEEDKIIAETRKILQTPTLPIHVRAVRVPTIRAHSMAVNVTFQTNPAEAASLLRNSPGVQFHPSPTPKLAENIHTVLYGPLRQDPTIPNTLDIWIVGDQLLRGAALTAFETAEILLHA